MAFQLADDLLDYGGSSAALGKNTGDDFREGKVTLPVILAFSRGDDAARAFWRRTIARGKQEEGDLARAMAYLAETDALTDTQATARAQGAESALGEALVTYADALEALRTSLSSMMRIRGRSGIRDLVEQG